MSEFELVANYVDGLINKNDKATVRSYTKQVYAQIDASSDYLLCQNEYPFTRFVVFTMYYLGSNGGL